MGYRLVYPKVIRERERPVRLREGISASLFMRVYAGELRPGTFTAIYG
jgi:hypothetical protein